MTLLNVIGLGHLRELLSLPEYLPRTMSVHVNTFVFLLLICPLLQRVSQSITQKGRGKIIFPFLQLPAMHGHYMTAGLPGSR